MGDKRKIAVLVSTKRPETLPGAFSCLKNQTFRDFDIVLISTETESYGRKAIREATAEYQPLIKAYYEAPTGTKHDAVRKLEDGTSFVMLPPDHHWEPAHLETISDGRISGLSVLGEFGGWDDALPYDGSVPEMCEHGMFLMKKETALQLVSGMQSEGLINGSEMSAKFLREYRKRILKDAELTGKPTLAIPWKPMYSRANMEYGGRGLRRILAKNKT